jgi:hypothetical protein
MESGVSIAVRRCTNCCVLTIEEEADAVDDEGWAVS